MKLNFNYDDYETEPRERIKYKLDVLQEFRDYLNSSFGKNTANTYYFAIKKFFARLEFNEPEQVSLEKIKSLMLSLKTADDVNTIKAALIQWKNCFPAAQIPDEDFMLTANSGKAHVKREKKVLQPKEIDTIKRKINGLREKRLKLAFRLMLASGLRGSEIETIKPEDVTVNDGIIKIIIAGRTVEVSDDDYLAKELVQLIGSSESGTRLFCSESTLQHKASERGFKCSDLRRAFLEREKAQ